MLFNAIKALARAPLIHFLLIGAAIYALYGIIGGNEDGGNERTVTVTAGDTQALTDQWIRLWSRPPTKDELAGVIRDHVRVQILYREAVAMGLDAGDTVIERRLAQKMEFLAQSLFTPEEPSDDELKIWYAANQDRFKQPDLYTITHIFFNPEKREATTFDDARATLEELKSLDGLPSDYHDYGDRFMLQNFYHNQSELDLRKQFGSGFAEKVVKLEPGLWHGPVLSGYGTHLVMVHEVLLSPLPAYADVKAKIKEEWTAEQIEKLSDRFLENLISRYEIIIEETEVPVTTLRKAAKL